MPNDSAMVDSVLKAIENERKGAVTRLIDWLRIPSVSTDPKHAPDCEKAARWAGDRLSECGFKVEILPTGTREEPGRPVVLAEIDAKPGYKGPHVLFYGHYDVQPADPLNLWESPPFDPVIKPATSDGVGERVVARGAVDDKGQVMTFLESCRAWHKTAGHATNGARFTVLLEGEEESGSENLEAFVQDHKARLEKTDVCLISDTGMVSREIPAITYGVRGLAYTEVTLHASNQDLHSGMWGGRCPNPITELCKVLAGLWDADRRVTIPGFYDDVRALAPEERTAWARIPFDQIDALKKIGLPKEADVGEKGFTALEREWGRPTAEINGIWGGYTGPGAKTVIPSHASAKVSFRLVADQKPTDITQKFFAWLKGRTPPGCRWELTDMHGGFGVTVPVDSPELKAAGRAVARAFGNEPALIKSGGSIPVAGMLKSQLGIDTIFMGFGLDDDRVHSPNEKFELECLRKGTRAHALFVAEITGA